MNKILGKKYVDSKGSVVALAIVLLILALGIGGFVFWLVHMNYENDLRLYNMDLWDYENGYSSYKPVPPASPIWKYVLIWITAIIAGVFLFFVPFMISKNQLSKGDNVVVLDETTRVLKVLSGRVYHSVPLNKIVKIKTENMGVIPAGKVFIPYKHSYGKLIIKYIKDGETIKIKSNDMQSVEEVAIKIESFLMNGSIDH